MRRNLHTALCKDDNDVLNRIFDYGSVIQVLRQRELVTHMDLTSREVDLMNEGL